MTKNVENVCNPVTAMPTPKPLLQFPSSANDDEKTQTQGASRQASTQETQARREQAPTHAAKAP